MKGDHYEGVAQYWYEDGTLQTSCTYKNNKVDGVLKSYYPSGRLQAEQNYSAGMLNGQAKSWDKDRQLISECTYKNGKLNGKYTEYYPNKAVKFEGNYILGDHEGTWLYYDAAGMIVGEGFFTMGTGVQKAFYMNGVIKQLTHYTKNEKDGEEIFYKPDGVPEVINWFEHGKLVKKITK